MSNRTTSAEHALFAPRTGAMYENHRTFFFCIFFGVFCALDFHSGIREKRLIMRATRELIANHCNLRCLGAERWTFDLNEHHASPMGE
jgi:hypothetical protein